MRLWRVETCISWTMMWRRVRVLQNPATAVSAPDQLLVVLLKENEKFFSHHMSMCKIFGKCIIYLKGGSCLLLHRKRAGSRHTQWWSGQAVAISDDVLLYLLYYDVIHKCSHNNTVGVIRNLTTCPNVGCRLQLWLSNWKHQDLDQVCIKIEVAIAFCCIQTECSSNNTMVPPYYL